MNETLVIFGICYIAAGPAALWVIYYIYSWKKYLEKKMSENKNLRTNDTQQGTEKTKDNNPFDLPLETNEKRR